MLATTDLDVFVESFELRDHPATVTFRVVVGSMRFESEITYASIPRWSDVLAAAPDGGARILGVLAAWDCMRFLALGGERMLLCDGLTIPGGVFSLWREAFLKQFGEWRFRNQLRYAGGGPALIATTSDSNTGRWVGPERDRWLLTNGGGKDTLAALMLIEQVQAPYDLYAGYLPVGGSHSTQKALLDRLRVSSASPDADQIEVIVRDDFFDRPDEDFLEAGVKAQFFKTDFAVGHTANYVGYIPLILHHGYTQLWFNIERSADDGMATWGTESINHQWCKSREYHAISRQVFEQVAGADWFQGFVSPIHGLYDVAIYKIVAQRPEALRQTHSCNYGKPWCRKCPKCLFCYLMMTAFVDESYAMEVLNCTASLFRDPACETLWEDLLSPKKVAWECVPSHLECRLAATICLQRGVDAPVLRKHRLSDAEAVEAYARFAAPCWEDTPALFRPALEHWLGSSRNPIQLDVMIVGAGQAGLSAAYEARQAGFCALVAEATEVGSAWAGRWDGFQLNTPNELTDLPGFQLPPRFRTGFAGKAEMQSLLKEYRETARLPVLEHCSVLSVERPAVPFEIQTTQGTWTSRSVIVASGHYAEKVLPPGADSLGAHAAVLHSADYRNPAQFAPGAVLVVGGGQSGAQIAEELVEAGRKVYWSVSDRSCNYRRFRGQDFNYWWDVSGIQHDAIRDTPTFRTNPLGGRRALREDDHPLVSGVGGDGLGHSISYRSMSEKGVTLLGRFAGATGQTAMFSQTLTDQIRRANAETRAVKDELNEIADRFGAPPMTPEDDAIDTDWLPPAAPASLNLVTDDISAVIFATGYRPDWPWLNVDPIPDVMGYPLGDGGMHPTPGLYFVGLFNLQRLSSICVCNGGRDARVVVEDLARFLSVHDRSLAASPPASTRAGPARPRVLAVLPSARELAVLKSLSHCDVTVLDPLTGPCSEPVSPSAAIEMAQQLELIVRSQRADAVYATNPFARAVVAAAVGENRSVRLPGPSIEAVMRTLFRPYSPGWNAGSDTETVWLRGSSLDDDDLGAGRLRVVRDPVGGDRMPFVADLSRMSSDTALSQALLTRSSTKQALQQLLRRHVDIIRFPLVDHDIAVLSRETDGALVEVCGWSDPDGRAHPWKTWGSRPLLTAITRRRLQELATDMAVQCGLRSTFWRFNAVLGVGGEIARLDIEACPTLDRLGQNDLRRLVADVVGLALGAQIVSVSRTPLLDAVADFAGHGAL